MVGPRASCGTSKGRSRRTTRRPDAGGQPRV